MNISIIIVSYNTVQMTISCLRSLKEAGAKEVLVVDNASTDESVAQIRQFFPEVKIIINKTNRGFSAANNQALKKSTGCYVIFLNPDTTIKPDTLQNAVAYMEANQNIGLAGAKILNPDGSLQPSVSYKYPGEKYSTSETKDLKGNIACVLGAFMIARKTLLDELKGFDEDFFLYGEDQDLCWRIREKGFSIGYIEDAEIFHWGGQSETGTPQAALFEKKMGAEYLFYRKHYLPSTINRIKKSQNIKAHYRLLTLNMLLPFARNKEEIRDKIDCYKIVLSMSTHGAS